MSKVVQYLIHRVIPSFLGFVAAWIIVSLLILPYLIYRQVQETDRRMEKVMELLQYDFGVGEATPEFLIPWRNDGIEVKVTAYTPTRDQCDDTPLITASNQRVRDGIIALSRDLEEEFRLEFGDTIVLEGIGVFEFQDRMHPRWTRKVDIFMWERQEALEFGVQETRLFLPQKSSIAIACNS
jgi:3D (Asp-Asp-Asp) domain-containing protein